MKYLKNNTRHLILLIPLESENIEQCLSESHTLSYSHNIKLPLAMHFIALWETQKLDADDVFLFLVGRYSFWWWWLRMYVNIWIPKKFKGEHRPWSTFVRIPA